MCSGTGFDAVGSSPIGVLGFTAKDLTPRALAVTPYVVDGVPTVTTMLALLSKAKMLRKRPAAALLAGGTHVAGATTISLHRSSDWFDTNIRRHELEKYPPARALLSIPFHRKLLWWYVGRVAISFDAPTCLSVGGTDRVTITSVVKGQPRITALADDLSFDSERIEVGGSVPNGPGCLLVHDETESMTELLQLRLQGTVDDGVFHVESRHGTLEPQRPGVIDQLRALRALRAAANGNRAAIEAWDR